MWRIGFTSGQSHVWEFGRGLAGLSDTPAAFQFLKR